MRKKLLIPIFLYLVISNNIFAQSGTSKNLAPDIYQEAVIYLKTGEARNCEIIVYKKDTLHHAYKYLLKGEKKKEKLNSSKIDSIKIGSSIYSKISYKVVSKIPKERGAYKTITKLSTQIVNGKYPLFASYGVYDYGYTFVDDKAGYIHPTYYVKINNTYKRIEDSNVISQLKKIIPDCEAVSIDKKEMKIKYDEIPNLFIEINSECN